VPGTVRILLAAAGLALLVFLAKAASDRQRARDEAEGRNPYPAMRRLTAVPRPAPVLSAPGTDRRPLPRIPVRWREMPPSETGVDFVHTWGGGTMDNLVKASGGGVTLFDFDGDRDLDLYFCQGAFDPVAAPGTPPATPPVNRLFRNEGGWKFTDATAASGLGDPGYGMGAAAADYDGDGDLDLYVANFGPDRLYRNEGGRFADVTEAAGIRCDGFSAGAAWGDADGDGVLDLLVCGYVQFDRAAKPGGPGEPFPGPLAYKGEPPRLLLGRADGTFRDATREAGLWTTAGRGMSVAFSDLLGTGRPMLLVANDAKPNFAYDRRPDGTFVERAFLLGLALSDLGQERSSMGITVFDADRDGRPDVAIPDGSGGTFYRNLDGRFEDQANPSGMYGAMGGRTGWSAAAVDYDLDGFPDLAITCGALNAQEPQAPVLFHNEGGGLFADASRDPRFARECLGRGCAAGDLDGDGDPDLVMASLGAGPLLLRNEGGEARRSLLVRCVAKGRNRDALGARVEVEADGLVQAEEVRTTQGYLSGSGPALLFGLGRAAAAERVTVRFPSGEVRTLEGVAAGSVEVRE